MLKYCFFVAEWRVTFRDVAVPFGVMKSSGDGYSVDCKKKSACLMSIIYILKNIKFYVINTFTADNVKASG